jgi:lipoate-protein ligase A
MSRGVPEVAYGFEGAGEVTLSDSGVPKHPRGNDRSIDCAGNVRADNALLRSGKRAFRVAVLSDHAISVGVGVRPDADYLERARAVGWTVVRRTSGGTAVVHAPGDLVWTLVLPRRDRLIGRDFVRAYDRLGRAVVEFLAARGLGAAWEPAPALSDAYCLLGSRGLVLGVDGRVLGGTAQHASGGALLHHGILPRTLDRPAIERVFRISASSGLDRLTCLEDLGVTESSRELAEQLESALVAELRAGPP